MEMNCTDPRPPELLSDPLPSGPKSFLLMSQDETGRTTESTAGRLKMGVLFLGASWRRPVRLRCCLPSLMAWHWLLTVLRSAVARQSPSCLSRLVTHTYEIVTSKPGAHSWILRHPPLSNAKWRIPKNVHSLSRMFAAPHQGAYKSAWHVQGPSDQLWMCECNSQAYYYKIKNSFFEVGLELAR